MWQFSETIDGLAEACTALGTPITGGNVSFYNETLGKSIYPTPVIGVLGILDDASRVLKIAFRNEGDLIVLLDGSNSPVGAQHAAPVLGNQTPALAREFSSSEYSKTIAGIVAGEPPAIDLAAEKRLQDCLVALAAEGAVQSAHDISDGGLAVTLAESCFAHIVDQPNACHPESPRLLRSEGSAFSALGAIANLGDEPSATEAAAFNERGARAIVSVTPSKLAHVLNTARQYNVAAQELGQVTRDGSFRIEHKGRAVIDSSVESLRDAWAHSLERIIAGRQT
jgi:phosphoribosylformylglycinamidine synthase